MKKNVLWVLAVILTYGLVVTSCSNNDEPAVPSTEEVEAVLRNMTLREKVGQMFFVRVGIISEERINQSVRRILALKLGMRT